jgi:uroporphyrin-III C-methyltransferase/precorrin-2 dehydrogenase/sirohydrochlorin ferrochelatase
VTPTGGTGPGAGLPAQDGTPGSRYPLLVDLTDRHVLVVGGGPVAARRAATVVQARARVHVIAPDLCEDLADLVAEGRVTWSPREARVEDVAAGPPPACAVAGSVSRWWLVHTATGDPGVDAAIADAAEHAGTWCVRADRAEASAAHTPATAHGPDGVQVAVSGGGDPGRARALRDAIAELLATGGLPVRPTRTTGRGRVVLVGGGPGDPGLITVAGRQWLGRADVVVADRLGPTGILAELDPTVEVIDVGKSAGNHPIPQEQINRILVEQAERGRTVVRLKGGDPFVLGRGGEEALHCIGHGIPVEVVPGVTSAISVPAAAGIPVTHRGITTSVVVASAHAGADDALDAARSAPPGATLVLLMGLSSLDRTAGELIAAGHRADTPVAVVSDGWSTRQRTVTATLDTIAREVAAAALPGPVVIVVGDVVGLRAELLPLDRRAAP